MAVIGVPNEEFGQEVKAIVQQAVNDAVRPLAKEISELKNKTGLSDIVGGIGILLGVLGGFAYLKARKELTRN